eukprot:CAMPEP_0194216942 /NCGR_PEP_ID=MMETSP0156-20130528/20051_1 /TAXON_ID=33649 /ORGANISM="Thalassionema nitzschioides, Strain L26-B" /LENGTH=439 /DNA_ID=CAMNT_0038945833 /DNA_START=83 /DNA_END=1402 /DNA_ORIENTATION=-
MAENGCDKDEEEKRSFEELMRLASPPMEISSINKTSLEALTKLNLPSCGISSLPSNLHAYIPNLSILFCPNNHFKELPPVIGLCPKLQMVSFKSNGMLSIHPDALKPQLRWLILTDNSLTTIPSEIGRLPLLQKLMLSGNQLKEIPVEISSCRNLELTRLASNKLTSPPMSLLELPNLAWVGLSANPFLSEITAKQEEEGLFSSLPVLNDPILESEDDGNVLGSGASGIIRKVLFNDQEVAVKTYVGQMTSDGSPDQERLLSLAASTVKSPFLIQLIGQTPHKKSLVMELLENFQALAGPPSMESCSRDVYPNDYSLTAEDGMHLVSGLLQVMMQLHARGIMHGDFYGHNILISDCAKKVKLSDFGAGFFYDPKEKYGACLEQIEVRAFGILVGEVIALVQRDVGRKGSVESLTKLLSTCRSSSTFSSILASWNSKSDG